MVNYINRSLMNAGPLVSIDGVVIHNDAGSGTPEWYVNWLANRDKNLGIAHYYINRTTIARVIDTNLIGYHTGHWPSNQRYIGYEVCQSMSASDADFLANEDMTLMQATEDLLFYGLPINGDTVRLHHEFVPTSCPHRSMSLHGNTTASVKAYFVQRMQYFASLGKTVDEMLTKLGQAQQGDTPKQQTEEEEEFMNFVARSKSGKQGYVGIVNGVVFGIADIGTVQQLQDAGAKHLLLDDGDFQRFLDSQGWDDKDILKSVKQMEKALTAQSGSGK